MSDQYGANCQLHPGAMFKPSQGCPTCEVGGAPYVLDARGFIPEAPSSNLMSRIDSLVSKLLDWTEHDHVALRRSAASLLRDAQAEIVRPSSVETAAELPRELLESLAYEHRDTSKFGRARDRLRGYLRASEKTGDERG